jgi:hypothetical protein
MSKASLAFWKEGHISRGDCLEFFYARHFQTLLDFGLRGRISFSDATRDYIGTILPSWQRKISFFT